MSATKLKPLYIMELFYKYSDETHRLSADDLVQLLYADYNLNSERKGIYRDIESLRSYGLDIVKSTTGYYLNNRCFSPAEINILISAVQSAAFITPDKTKALFEKLTGFLSVYQAENIGLQANLGGIKYRNEEIYSTIESINRAIALKRKLSFYYYKRNIEGKEVLQRAGRRYIVSPYAMIWLQERYYLVCCVVGHDELTHFRIDRMKKVYVEHEAYRHFSEVSEYRHTFDIADYTRKCINMFGGDITRVTLRCKNGVINEILDKFGDDVRIFPGHDGYFTARIDVAVSLGFLSWVAQFFGDVKILSPEPVCKMLRDKVCALYDTVKVD